MEQMDFLESDDNTFPPKKRVKCDSLPKLDDWSNLFDFRNHTTEPPDQVFKFMVAEAKEKIKAAKQAYHTLSMNQLEDLEKKQPCSETSIVIEAIRKRQESVKDDFRRADKMLPVFEEDVDNYLKHRDNLLLEVRDAENLYYGKLERFVEIPDIDKMIKWLRCNFKDYQLIEKRSSLSIGDMHGICYFLRLKKQIFFNEENLTDKEQFDESEMELMLNESQGSIKEICSLRSAMEAAEVKINEYVQNHEFKVVKRMTRFFCTLRSCDAMVRILRGQLDLLVEKNVITKGYDEDFFDDWKAVRDEVMFKR